jgi:diguanylate cyclase (GGDEF)-like protein
VIALLLALLLCGPAVAQEPLVLDDRARRVEAWPAVSVLRDPTRQLSIDEVRARADRFAPPEGAYATLGLSKDAVWLRLPVRVPANQAEAQQEGRWVLDIDYPPINRIDVYVAGDQGVVQHARLGNTVPFSERPMRSRSHSVELHLAPGATAQIYVRVETQGAMVLPLTLSTPGAFHEHALREQMLQGLLSGLGLCLLLYSLMQWINLREPLFAKYAVLIGGGLTFLAFQFGIGAQFLWTDNFWLERHVPGLAALTACAGTFLFVEQALASPQTPRLFSQLMKAGAAALFVVGLLFAFDAIDLHAVTAVVGTLGLMPAVMGMPGTIARARRGDSVGWYFLVAWAGYFATTAVMVGMIKGRVDVNFWTLHSFQLGNTLDMLVFLRVIGLRLQAVHAAAQRATRERDQLRSLAHSDPLTGLANRRGLDASLAALLPRCTPQDMLAVYMLDLDGFKNVNDRHGHDVGDELLVAVARRLQATVRADDVVARLGGDEFVVMAGGLKDEHQAHEVGLHLVEAFGKPFDVRGHACSVGVTVGYVLVPLDGNDPVRLLKRADEAMYAGKQSGKSCLRRGAPAAA